MQKKSASKLTDQIEASLEFQKQFKFVNVFQNTGSNQKFTSARRTERNHIKQRSNKAKGHSIVKEEADRYRYHSGSKQKVLSGHKNSNSIKKLVKNNPSKTGKGTKLINKKFYHQNIFTQPQIFITKQPKSSKRDFLKNKDWVPKNKLKDNKHKSLKKEQIRSVSQRKSSKLKYYSELDKLPFSQIKKTQRKHQKEENVCHQYFGIHDVLASLVDNQQKNSKERRSKLSTKCKSSCSVSSKKVKK